MLIVDISTVFDSAALSCVGSALDEDAGLCDCVCAAAGCARAGSAEIATVDEADSVSELIKAAAGWSADSAAGTGALAAADTGN